MFMAIAPMMVGASAPVVPTPADNDWTGYTGSANPTEQVLAAFAGGFGSNYATDRIDDQIAMICDTTTTFYRLHTYFRTGDTYRWVHNASISMGSFMAAPAYVKMVRYTSATTGYALLYDNNITGVSAIPFTLPPENTGASFTNAVQGSKVSVSGFTASNTKFTGAVSSLDTNGVAVSIWRSSTGRLNAIRVSASGATVALSAATELSATTFEGSLAIARIDANRFIVSAKAGSTLRVGILTDTGSSFSYADVAGTTGLTTVTGTGVAVLSDTLAVVACSKGSAIWSCAVTIGSGSSLTLGTASSVATGTTLSGVHVSRLSATQAMVTYVSSTTSTLALVVGVTDTTVAAISTPLVISTATNQGYVATMPLDATSVVACYSNGHVARILRDA